MRPNTSSRSLSFSLRAAVAGFLVVLCAGICSLAPGSAAAALPDPPSWFTGEGVPYVLGHGGADCSGPPDRYVDQTTCRVYPPVLVDPLHPSTSLYVGASCSSYSRFSQDSSIQFNCDFDFFDDADADVLKYQCQRTAFPSNVYTGWTLSQGVNALPRQFATLAGCIANGAGTAPPPKPSADIASTCGTARFDWYHVYHERFLRKGSKACAFVVSNRVARELVKLAFAGPTDDGRDMTHEFFSLIKTQVIADTDENLEERGEALDKLKELLKEHPYLNKVIPSFAKGVETAGKSDPLYKAAELLLDHLHVTLGATKLALIVNKNACFAIRAEVRSSSRVRARGAILQNPAHTSDKSASTLAVTRRIPRSFPRPDKFEEVPTNLACNKKGLVTTAPLRKAGTVFKNRKTRVGSAAP